MFPDQRFRRPNLAVVQALILRQINHRLKPEFRFPVRVMHVHVEPRFLAREEKEPESTLAEDCRAQELPFRHLTSQFSGRTLPCEARRERIMKWSARGVATLPCHGPLQLLVMWHS